MILCMQPLTNWSTAHFELEMEFEDNETCNALLVCLESLLAEAHLIAKEKGRFFPSQRFFFLARFITLRLLYCSVTLSFIVSPHHPLLTLSAPSLPSFHPPFTLPSPTLCPPKPQNISSTCNTTLLWGRYRLCSLLIFTQPLIKRCYIS
jgi:hypothetical protein